MEGRRRLSHHGPRHLHGIMEACAELDLWPNFGLMLRAYEEAAES